MADRAQAAAHVYIRLATDMRDYCLSRHVKLCVWHACASTSEMPSYLQNQQICPDTSIIFETLDGQHSAPVALAWIPGCDIADI